MTLRQLTPALLGLGNVENTSDMSKIVSDPQITALGLKANLTGATFTGPIHTNSNINLTGAGILKYPSGTAGQVLVSDANGLLTLGNLPVPSLSCTSGTKLLVDNTIPNTETANDVPISVLSFSLSPGTYLISTRCIIQGLATSVNFNVYSIRQAMSTTANSLDAGIIANTYSKVSFNPYVGIGSNVTYVIPEHKYIINVPTTGTYYINTASYYMVPTSQIVYKMDLTAFALKIA